MEKLEIFGYRTIPAGQTVRQPLSWRAFQRYLGRLASRKAHGPDGVPAELLKAACKPFQRRLWALVNEILAHKFELPAEVMISKIRLLYKKNESDRIENYRPIALLNSIYQLLNCVLTDRYQRLTERHCVLETSQFGNRWLRGVPMSAQKQQWLLREVQRSNGTLLRIDLDCVNAFNACSHAAIWAVLAKLGVPDGCGSSQIAL